MDYRANGTICDQKYLWCCYTVLTRLSCFRIPVPDLCQRYVQISNIVFMYYLLCSQATPGYPVRNEDMPVGKRSPNIIRQRNQSKLYSLLVALSQVL